MKKLFVFATLALLGCRGSLDACEFEETEEPSEEPEQGGGGAAPEAPEPKPYKSTARTWVQQGETFRTEALCDVDSKVLSGECSTVEGVTITTSQGPQDGASGELGWLCMGQAESLSEGELARVTATVRCEVSR